MLVARIFLEIGPRHTLIRLGGDVPAISGLTWLASLNKEKHDQEQMLESLGRLYERGVQVRLGGAPSGLLPDENCTAYHVFERTIILAGNSAAVCFTHNRNLRVRHRKQWRSRRNFLDKSFAHHWQRSNSNRAWIWSLPMLQDHCILDTLLMPGAGQIVRVLAAAEQLTASQSSGVARRSISRAVDVRRSSRRTCCPAGAYS